jgi:DNA replication protein DnaC
MSTDAELQAKARELHEEGEHALLPLRLREWRVPAPERAALLSGEAPRRGTPALAHVEHFADAPGSWLLALWGGYRVGKTYAALRWLLDAARVPMDTLEHGRTFRYAPSARFVPFTALADAAGSFRADHRALVEQACTARALVLDDVGAQLRAAAPILDQVISARHLHRRPTLLTTNLGPELFGRAENFGARVGLRLEEGGGFRCCGGDDERDALRAALEDA